MLPVPCHTSTTVKKEEFEHSLLALWMKTNIPLTRANLQYHTGESSKSVRQLVDELLGDRVISAETDTEGELVFTVPGAKRPASGPRTFDEHERLQRLMGEVEADMSLKRAQQEKLEAEAHARRRAVASEQKAMVLAKRSDRRELEVAAPSHSEGLEELGDGDEKPGFLARLFGKRGFGARDALEVAGAAKGEFEGKAIEKKEKSLLISGGASFLLGPVGWLYAGSFREAVPGSLLYLALASVLQHLPSFLVLPIAGVALPISGLIGVGYAWQYNRKGKRVRMLTDPTKKKKLKG
jgi:hypothetical protein